MHLRIALSSALALALALPMTVPAADFTLKSTDFAEGGRIPDGIALDSHGCSGGNRSPALSWSGTPSGTRSFLVTMFDPDEKHTDSGWWHWVVYDIPGDVHALAAGAGALNSKTLPTPAIQARTDLGTHAYHGPCPDPGKPAHRYVITLYALSIEHLDVDREASPAMIQYTAGEFVVGKATLTGLYAVPAIRGDSP